MERGRRPRQRRHLWHPCCLASAARHALQGTWTHCRLPYPTARLRRGAAALLLPRGRGRAGLEEQQMCGPASLSGPAQAGIWRPHVSPRPLPPPPVPCRLPAPCSMSTLRHRRHCSTVPLIQRAVQACCVPACGVESTDCLPTESDSEARSRRLSRRRPGRVEGLGRRASGSGPPARLAPPPLLRLCKQTSFILAILGFSASLKMSSQA